MNTLLKTLVIGMSAAGLALVGAPVLAADNGESAPATEHQEEALKKKDESAESQGDTQKEATGDKESSEETELPATEHQEETLKGEQDTGDDTRQQMEDPEAPR